MIEEYLENYLIERIATRVKGYRDDMGMTQQEVCNEMTDDPLDVGGDHYLRPALSYIEKGRTRVANKTFITDDMLKCLYKVYHDFFDIDYNTLIFGTDEEIIEFVYEIFLKVTYNLDVSNELKDKWGNDHIGYDEKLTKFSDRVVKIELYEELNVFDELLCHYGEFAYMLAHLKRTHLNHIGFADYDDYKILDYAEENDFVVYQNAVDILWNKEGGYFVDLFRETFCDGEDVDFGNGDVTKVSMKKLGKRIVEWINTEFYSKLESIRNKWSNELVMKTGYLVKKQQEIIFNTYDTEIRIFGNDFDLEDYNIINHDEEMTKADIGSVLRVIDENMQRIIAWQDSKLWDNDGKWIAD